MKRLLKRWWWLNKLVLVTISSYHTQAQTFQNMVPNGSFETYTQCPNNGSQIYFAPPWTGPTINSTDYLNACSANYNAPYYGGGSLYPYYLNAKTGVAYIGMHVYNSQNYREYAQVELSDTLRNGFCYYIEFYATTIQNAKYRVNNIAANLSNSNFPLNLSPNNSLLTLPMHITNYNNPILTDTVKWEKVCGIYNASGNEKYITIGNFRGDALTDTFRIYGQYPVKDSYISKFSYIFIDAVSVYSINPNGVLPWSYRDTTINKGDSVYIGNKMGGLNFHPQWFTQNGTYIKTNAGITVSPTVTTKYVVQYTLCGVQRTDTVKVTVPLDTLGNDVSIERLKLLSEVPIAIGIKIYPVPANEMLELKINNEKLITASNLITIYNNLGQIMREEEITFKNGVAQIKTDEFENGVYMLNLRSGNSGTVSKRFVISR